YGGFQEQGLVCASASRGAAATWTRPASAAIARNAATARRPGPGKFIVSLKLRAAVMPPSVATGFRRRAGPPGRSVDQRLRPRRGADGSSAFDQVDQSCPRKTTWRADGEAAPPGVLGAR